MLAIGICLIAGGLKEMGSNIRNDLTWSSDSERAIDIAIEQDKQYGHIAWTPSLPGLQSFGKTPEIAKSRLLSEYDNRRQRCPDQSSSTAITAT